MRVDVGKAPRTGAVRKQDRRIRECVMGPTWKRAELMGKPRTAVPETSQRFGRCLYPLHFASTTSSEIFELWRFISNRGTAPCAWEPIPPRCPP